MSDSATFGEEILTTGEVAQRLKISRRAVQWMIKQRKLQAVRIGRAYRVRPQHIEAFLTNPRQNYLYLRAELTRPCLAEANFTSNHAQ
jgi:excisionase family DNA binding protein